MANRVLGWIRDGFGPFDERDCKDGTKRRILRNLKDLPIIFGEFFPEWSTKVSAGVGELGAVEGTVEVAKTAAAAQQEVSRLQSEMITKFKIIYVIYSRDPCSNDYLLEKFALSLINQAPSLNTLQDSIQSLKNEPEAALVNVRTMVSGMLDSLEQSFPEHIRQLWKMDFFQTDPASEPERPLPEIAKEMERNMEKLRLCRLEDSGTDNYTYPENVGSGEQISQVEPLIYDDRDLQGRTIE